SIDPSSPEPALALRRHITGLLNVPVYRAFHEWLGRSDVLAPMWEAWSHGDRKAAVASVPPRLIDQLILRGSMGDIAAGVRRYLDAGIDTEFLSLITLETDPSRKRRMMIDALRALAPRGA